MIELCKLSKAYQCSVFVWNWQLSVLSLCEILNHFFHGGMKPNYQLIIESGSVSETQEFIFFTFCSCSGVAFVWLESACCESTQLTNVEIKKIYLQFSLHNSKDVSTNCDFCHHRTALLYLSLFDSKILRSAILNLFFLGGGLSGGRVTSKRGVTSIWGPKFGRVTKS